jgi:DNA-binding response OmpR family regulator
VSKPTLLLVERRRSPGASFADALKKRYEVMLVSSAREALDVKQPLMAVILDAISMRTPGDRIARQIKEGLVTTPLIHLHPGPKESANSPAETVLFMPFTSRKLVNVIERLSQPAEDEKIISCGGLSMNVTRRVLVARGQETPLTPKLALLVEIFLQHPGETLDRKQLMEYVWQTDYLGDTRTLDVHVRWFRRAIESDPSSPRYLKTVRGVGYRLEIPDSELAALDNTPLTLQKV